MIQGGNPTPLARFDRAGLDFQITMTEKDTERGAKRGVLDTGRAKQLDKTKDADADAADENEEE